MIGSENEMNIVDMKLGLRDPLPNICLIDENGNILIYKVKETYKKKNLKPDLQYLVQAKNYKIQKSKNWKILKFAEKIAYFQCDSQIVVIEFKDQKNFKVTSYSL